MSRKIKKDAFLIYWKDESEMGFWRIRLYSKGKSIPKTNRDGLFVFYNEKEIRSFRKKFARSWAQSEGGKVNFLKVSKAPAFTSDNS